mmetsp:Transcript_5181/g.10960  ORF Transcript_5181/g.10960 Transcript_5181/m.10960 type:complete len:267 (+) Transcript_5181:515-1315(+)
MQSGKDGGCECGTLGIVLLDQISTIPLNISVLRQLVSIAKGTLDKRNIHKLRNTLRILFRPLAVAHLKMLLSLMKVLKDFSIDPGLSIGMRATVESALVGERIEQVSTVVTLRLSQRSGVECNGFVPGSDGLIIALSAGRIIRVAFQAACNIAIIDGIAQFANNVHECVHVCCTLLHGLTSSNETKLGEIGVAVARKGSCRPGRSGLDPIIGVLKVLVVVVEGGVLRVRTAGASVFGVVHLLLGPKGEAGDRPSIQIFFFDIVVVL